MMETSSTKLPPETIILFSSRARDDARPDSGVDLLVGRNRAVFAVVGCTSSYFVSPLNAELRIPYNDPRELIMDTLKYGADVELMGPEGLRKEVIERLRGALMRYSRD